MAARFSSCGHFVFATMRDLSKQKPLLDELAKRNSAAKILPLDVTDKLSIKDVISEILTTKGHIDVLINNAGYGIGGSFEDLTEEEIRAQFETNFFGVQNVTREVIPVMRQQRSGTIINISSVAGLYALPSFGAYNASKWALEGFSESLFYELKPFGIRVSLIEPGTYPTTIFRENKRYAKNSFNSQSPYFPLSQFLDARVKEYVDGLQKDPEDIAKLAERIINSKNPPLRNFPDIQSRGTYFLKRILPFRIFSGLLLKGLLQGFNRKA